MGGDQGQLPGQIEGILHARIHPLGPQRRVDMGSISRQKDASLRVLVDLVLLDLEPLESNRL